MRIRHKVSAVFAAAMLLMLAWMHAHFSAAPDHAVGASPASPESGMREPDTEERADHLHPDRQVFKQEVGRATDRSLTPYRLPVATTASALWDALVATSLTAAQQAMVWQDVAAYCISNVDDPRFIGSDVRNDPVRYQQWRRAMDRANAFCQGVVFDDGAIDQAIAHAGEQDRTRQLRDSAAVLHASRGKPDADRLAVIEAALVLDDLAFGAVVGPESERAALVLDMHGYISPRLLQAAREHGFSTAQETLRTVQKLAVQMRRCDILGGCGPGEFYSVQACAGAAACPGDVTVAAAWQRRYAPATIEAARQFVDYLRANPDLPPVRPPGG